MSTEACMHENVGGMGFDFLSYGKSSSHPAEILGSDPMRDLIGNLRKKYDIILIDSPPYLAVADVIVLSEFADAIAVITRYQVTDKRHLQGIKKRFSGAAGNKMIGVVINQVSVREKDYYYHQYYYYGYGDGPQPK